MFSKDEVEEFHKNCREGNLDEIENILSKHPSLLNEEGYQGKSI